MGLSRERGDGGMAAPPPSLCVDEERAPSVARCRGAATGDRCRLFTVRRCCVVVLCWCGVVCFVLLRYLGHLPRFWLMLVVLEPLISAWRQGGGIFRPLSLPPLLLVLAGGFLFCGRAFLLRAISKAHLTVRDNESQGNVLSYTMVFLINTRIEYLSLIHI